LPNPPHLSCSPFAQGDHHGNHHGDHHHGGASEHAQTITKEMDLDHLEHAGFDPEAAAFEDGMDPEDLGYDVEEEDEEDFAGENCLRHWFLVEPMLHAP